MRRSALLLCALFALASLSVLPQPASAQFFDWDLGFSEGENITVTLDEDGEASVEFWISNDNLVSITVSIGYSVPFNGQANGPEDATIPSGDNMTFTMEIRAIDTLSIRADKTGEFKVNANLESQGGVPDFTGDSREEKSDLQIPRIRGFDLMLEEPAGAMNAGTQLEMDIKVYNTGNDIDAILDPVFESNICPQLAIDGLDGLEDVAIDAPIDSASGVKTFTVNVVAPQSHSTKVCDISISIRSLGEANAGSISAAAEDKVNLEVRKVSGGSSASSGSDGSDDSSGSSEDSGDIITRNFTPSIGLMAAIAAFGCAALLRRDDTD